MARYAIIMENDSGELDRREANNVAEISDKVIEIANDVGFAHGDRIRIHDFFPERDADDDR
jgi:hypothetical protein